MSSMTKEQLKERMLKWLKEETSLSGVPDTFELIKAAMFNLADEVDDGKRSNKFIFIPLRGKRRE